jgi:hypothetical protein
VDNHRVTGRATVLGEDGNPAFVGLPFSIVGCGDFHFVPPVVVPPVVVPEIVTFDSDPLTSDLPLGGSVHLVMRKNGDFTFSCHAHDSGFDNINYVVSAVLMTPSGIAAFTLQHQGHVEGTSAGLPFGTPNRNDDFTTGGNNPLIANVFGGMSGAKLEARIAGTDTLVGGLQDMLSDLLKAAAAKLGTAAAEAVIALVTA